jgi:hypothetical protein
MQMLALKATVTKSSKLPITESQLVARHGFFVFSLVTAISLVTMVSSRALAQPPLPPLLEPPIQASEPTPALAPTPVLPKQSSSPKKADSALPFTDTQAIESMDGLLVDIARNAIPIHYENTKDWGKTKERWDGLHISRDGFQIKTKRRKKAVNHGTWKKYEIKNLSPDEFKLEIVNVRKFEDGVKFEVFTEAHLGVFGRLSQWELGVQLFSISADAEARVKLHMECFMRMQFDPSKLPPDVVLDPRVDNAKLEIVEFRLKDVSRLGGTLSKQLGKGVRKVLEDRIVDEPEKLVAKINRQIDKERDDLRFSLYDLIKSKLQSGKKEAEVAEKTELEKSNRK